MRVRGCMTPKVKFAVSENSLKEAATIMANGDCGAIPIVGGDGKVVGMLTDRDICLAIATRDRPPSEIPVSEVMSTQVFACGPEEDVQQALKTMQNKRVRRLPVVTDEGKLTGILSMDDVVLRAEAGNARSRPGVSYGEAVGTLKAIYARPAVRRPVIVEP